MFSPSYMMSIMATADSSGGLQQFITDQPVIFWSVVAAVAVILIAAAIGAAIKKKRKTAVPVVVEEQEEPQQVEFLPVEDDTQEIEVEFLTMPDKLLSAEGELDLKLVEQIKNKGPQALADIVAAYDKCRPEIQQQLAQLVKDERLMERYSRRLNRDDYPQGVLLDAWSRFPNQDTL